MSLLVVWLAPRCAEGPADPEWVVSSSFAGSSSSDSWAMAAMASAMAASAAAISGSGRGGGGGQKVDSRTLPAALFFWMALLMVKYFK